MTDSTFEILLLIYKISIVILIITAFNKNTRHIFEDNNSMSFILFIIFMPIINTIIVISLLIDFYKNPMK